MCRNIKTLANFEPPATDDEIRASALQFVRKLSGMNRPSRANQQAFDHAVDEVTAAAHRLDVEMPITEGVCAVLDGTPLTALVARLMERHPTVE